MLEALILKEESNIASKARTSNKMHVDITSMDLFLDKKADRWSNPLNLRLRYLLLIVKEQSIIKYMRIHLQLDKLIKH